MTNDPFEEFEFRPLTEGLGFHRQQGEKKHSSFEMKGSLPEIEMPLSPRSKYEKTSESKQPLRRSQLDEPKKSESSATVDEILKTLQAKRKVDFQEAKEAKAASETQGPAYRTTSPDISSYVLDGMLVTAATLACMIILLMVTQVDLFGVISQTEDALVFVSLYTLFAGVAWIYLVMNRVFLGFTPGEWVFDQRVGMPQDQGTTQYCGRVLLRATLVTLTGLVIVPILSVVARRDLAGMATGASLLKKV